MEEELLIFILFALKSKLGSTFHDSELHFWTMEKLEKVLPGLLKKSQILGGNIGAVDDLKLTSSG